MFTSLLDVPIFSSLSLFWWSSSIIITEDGTRDTIPSTGGKQWELNCQGITRVWDLMVQKSGSHSLTVVEGRVVVYLPFRKQGLGYIQAVVGNGISEPSICRFDGLTTRGGSSFHHKFIAGDGFFTMSWSKVFFYVCHNGGGCVSLALKMQKAGNTKLISHVEF